MFRNRKFNIELKYYKFPLCFRRYVDVVEVLIDSIDASAYWTKISQRLKQEENETVTNCNGFKYNSNVNHQQITDKLMPTHHS